MNAYTLFLIFSLFVLNGCQHRPPCANYGESRSLKGNAGCLILNDQQFLAIQQRSNNQWNLPGGTAETGETAQCTAARETREETGLAVSVGKVLSKKENGFYVFECHLMPNQKQQEYSIPFSGWFEVKHIAWRSPSDIEDTDWRYPTQWGELSTLIDSMLAERR